MKIWSTAEHKGGGVWREGKSITSSSGGGGVGGGGSQVLIKASGLWSVHTAPLSPSCSFFPPSYSLQPFELLLGCLRNPFIIFNAEYFKATSPFSFKAVSSYLLNRRKKRMFWTVDDSELFTCSKTS